MSKNSTKTLSKIEESLLPKLPLREHDSINLEFHIRQTAKSKSILGTDKKTYDQEFLLEEHEDSEIIKKSGKLDYEEIESDSRHKPLFLDPFKPLQKQNIKTLLFPNTNSSKKLWSTHQSLINSSNGQIFESMDPRNMDLEHIQEMKRPESKFIGLSQNEIDLNFRRKMRKNSRSGNQSQNLGNNLKINKLLSSRKKNKRKGSSQILSSNKHQNQKLYNTIKGKDALKAKVRVNQEKFKKMVDLKENKLKSKVKIRANNFLNFKSKNLKKLFGNAELNDSDFDFAKQRGLLKPKKSKISQEPARNLKGSTSKIQLKDKHAMNRILKRQYSIKKGKLSQQHKSRLNSMSKAKQSFDSQIYESGLLNGNRKLLKKIVSKENNELLNLKNSNQGKFNISMSRNILDILGGSKIKHKYFDSKFMTETFLVDTEDKLKERRPVKRKKSNIVRKQAVKKQYRRKQASLSKINHRKGNFNKQNQRVAPNRIRSKDKQKYYYKKRHLSQNYNTDLAENQTQQSIYINPKECTQLSPNSKQNNSSQKALRQNHNRSKSYFNNSVRKQITNLKSSRVNKFLNSSSTHEFQRSQHDLKNSSSSLNRSVAPSNGFMTVREKIARGKLNPYNYTEKKLVLKNARRGGRSELGNSGMSARKMETGMTSVEFKKKYQREIYGGHSRVKVC